jgi:hypothetical protein
LGLVRSPGFAPRKVQERLRTSTEQASSTHQRRRRAAGPWRRVQHEKQSRCGRGGGGAARRGGELWQWAALLMRRRRPRADGACPLSLQDGYTSLAIAAKRWGHAEVVRLLLEAPGIDPNKVNKVRRFALAARRLLPADAPVQDGKHRARTRRRHLAGAHLTLTPPPVCPPRALRAAFTATLPRGPAHRHACAPRHVCANRSGRARDNGGAAGGRPAPWDCMQSPTGNSGRRRGARTPRFSAALRQWRRLPVRF